MSVIAGDTYAERALAGTLSARTDSSTKFEYASQNTTGIYIPNGWGQFWKPKRDSAKTSIARVGIVGDSIASGYWASDLTSKTWVALVRSALQGRYGDGGSGFRSTSRSQPALTNASFAAGVITYYAGVADNLIGTTGAWTYNTAGAGWGAGGGVMTVAASGATATFSVRGTKIDVYTLTGPSNGSFNVTIDGSSVGSINTVAANGTLKTTYTVAAGTHTVVLTSASATAVWLSGVSGENATGIAVHNFSVPGALNGWFSTTGNSSGAFGPSAAWSGGNKNPVDLYIYSLGLNDANAGNTAGDAFAKNVKRAMAQVKSTGTAVGATDVLFIINHLGSYDATNEVYQDYAYRLRGIAENYGAALVNLWTLGRNSYGYMNSLGYWGNSASPGSGGSDLVHLSDAGHQWTANQILPIILA